MTSDKNYLGEGNIDKFDALFFKIRHFGPKHEGILFCFYFINQWFQSSDLFDFAIFSFALQIGGHLHRKMKIIVHAYYVFQSSNNHFILYIQKAKRAVPDRRSPHQRYILSTHEASNYDYYYDWNFVNEEFMSR